MAVFTQSEVAKIVGMKRTLLKNWTMDRPLTIIPSERPARGPGSPNLYSRQDIYLIALAYKLSQAGLAVKERIKGLLQHLKEELPKLSPDGGADLRNVALLNIELEGDDMSIELITPDDIPRASLHSRRPENIRQIVLVKYTVNVMALVQMIDQGILDFENMSEPGDKS